MSGCVSCRCAVGGERGAELWTAACGERPAQCFPLLLELCEHPEWLSLGAQTALGVSSTPTVPGELSEELWRAVARHGFDPASLRESLRRIVDQRQLAAMWARLAAIGRCSRSPGRRLPGGRGAAELRVMDEIDAARLRAHDMRKTDTACSACMNSFRRPLMTIGDADVIWGSGLFRDPTAGHSESALAGTS
ncbi:MAG: hypothetical protein U0787_05485 [Polyangia bacterium]